VLPPNSTVSVPTSTALGQVVCQPQRSGADVVALSRGRVLRGVRTLGTVVGRKDCDGKLLHAEQSLLIHHALGARTAIRPSERFARRARKAIYLSRSGRSPADDANLAVLTVSDTRV